MDWIGLDYREGVSGGGLRRGVRIELNREEGAFGLRENERERERKFEGPHLLRQVLPL